MFEWWLSKIGRLSRRAVITIVCLIGFTLETAHAQGQRSRKPAEIEAPKVATKLYKRPLLRSGRIQFCLKQLGRYDGRITGRMTPATARALRRFRDDFDLMGEDVAQDWPLHALLWRQCRDEWGKAGGHLDRFGLAVTRPELPHASTEKMLPEVGLGRSPTLAATRPAEPAAAKQSMQPAACLPADLREILLRGQPPRPTIGVCEASCLPLPPYVDRDDAQVYERRLGISWCKSCVPFSGDLLFDDIVRIEKAGNITLCPDPRRLMRARTPTPLPGATLLIDGLRGTRALFRRDTHAAERHNGFAVVIGVSAYSKGLALQPRAERDAAGMQALLVERLGFNPSRVVELKNSTLAEFEDVFGRAGAPKGLLSERLKEAPGVPLVVYFSGAAAISGETGEGYLLPADAAPNRERSGGYALSTLYQNLARLGAGSVTVMLEANFGGNSKSPLVSPNGPVTEADILPRPPARGFVVLSATDRDQQSLEDPETGLSLFTRFLLQGLSGHADVGPIGDRDGIVDSAEAFVYAASRTTAAAAKLFGVLQRPTLSQSKAVPLAKLGGQTR